MTKLMEKIQSILPTLKLGIKNSNDLILLIISIASLILLKPHLSMTVGLIILGVAIIGFSITRNLLYSIAIAVITINIIVLLNYTGYMPVNIENFENKTTDESKEDVKPVDEKEKDASKDITDSKPVDIENQDEFNLDSKGSFLENIKSLSPKQLSGLNNDTKELIDTQKQLLETLNNMGPALKEGKTILDTFKQYFGNDMDIKANLENMKAL
jgi:hypothetical protein